MQYLFSAKQLDSNMEVDFPILKCQKCGHAITVIGDFDINRTYQTGNYDKKEKIWHKMVRPFLNLLEQNKLKLLSSNIDKKGHILEVGCGKGKFLEIAKINGYKVLGLEPSPRSFSFAANKLPGKILNKTIHEAHDAGDLSQKYIAIVLWHVLEHIHDLDKTIRILKNILADNGKIMLAVPNNSSFQSIFGKGNWLHLDPPRHIHHFCPNSMELLVNKFDLQIKQISYNSFYQNFIGELFTFTNIIIPYKNALLNAMKDNPLRQFKNKYKTIFLTILAMLITIVAFIPITIYTIIIAFLKKSGTMVVMAEHKLT